MKQNLILIGFMGAGKTTIGKLYAAEYALPLLDVDELIEEKAGMSVSEIFETSGEERFRQMETQVLKELLNHTDHTVISVGGGLPVREENRELLKQLGTIVYLKVDEMTVIKRLEKEHDRPLLEGDHVEQRVADLLRIRRPIYAQTAHKTICAADKSPAEIVAELGEMMGGRNEIIGDKRTEPQFSGDQGEGDLWNGGLSGADVYAEGKGSCGGS